MFLRLCLPLWRTQVFVILTFYKITVTVFIENTLTSSYFSLSSPLLGSFSGQTLPPLVRSWFCWSLLGWTLHSFWFRIVRWSLSRFWPPLGPCSSFYIQTPTTLWRCNTWCFKVFASQAFVRDFLRATKRTLVLTTAATAGLAINPPTLVNVNRVTMML